MSIQYIDDTTKEVITDGRGVEVNIMVGNGQSMTRHYADWKNLPAEILAGNFDGAPYITIVIKDRAAVTRTPPNKTQALALPRHAGQRIVTVP